MRNPAAQQRARRLRNDATDSERHLWRHLRNRQLGGFRFRRQVPLQGFVADFACFEAKLVIELDGGQHAESVAYDEQRDRLLDNPAGAIGGVLDLLGGKKKPAEGEAGTKTQEQPKTSPLEDALKGIFGGGKK